MGNGRRLRGGITFLTLKSLPSLSTAGGSINGYNLGSALRNLLKVSVSLPSNTASWILAIEFSASAHQRTRAEVFIVIPFTIDPKWK